MWFTVVTMCTVGYGDFTPNSMLGRLFGLVIALLGIWQNYIVTLVLLDMVDFTSKEKTLLNKFDYIVKKNKMFRLLI